MSTRSKVKRQVRRNVREHAKARARRELCARWQSAAARGLHTSSAAYWMVHDVMVREHADAIVLALNSPGGPVDEFMRVTFGGMHVPSEPNRVEYSIDAGRNYSRGDAPESRTET